MDQIKIGPTGWGSVLRKTFVETLGDVTINVDSRGGVEVIRKAGHRDYRGWYSEQPESDTPPSGTWTATDEGYTAKHEFEAAVGSDGVVHVLRQDGSRSELLGFDVTGEPDYRGETTRELEAGRNLRAGAKPTR